MGQESMDTAAPERSNPEQAAAFIQKFSSSLGERDATRHCARWQDLNAKCISLQRVISMYSDIGLHQPAELLSRAQQMLCLNDEYRVVIIGETGAGKSTLLNALLQKRVLVTGGGAAITGAAIYIYPESNSSEYDKAEIVLRDVDEYRQLIFDIIDRELGLDAHKRYFNNPSSVTPDDVIQLAHQYDSTRHKLPDWKQKKAARVEAEVIDIAKTWKRSVASSAQKRLFVLPRDQDELNRLLDESSDFNRNEQTRIIPAIKYAQCVLRKNLSSYICGKISDNIVFVDVPGSAAKTYRHLDILHQEIKRASVVILVVRPDRPAEEEGTSIANLIQDALFRGYSEEEKGRFAKRVFIVVNKEDQLTSDEDKERLHASLSDLCNIIGDSTLINTRCVKVTAEKSILAHILREKEQIRDATQRKFYSSLAHCAVESLSSINPDILDVESNVPVLLEQLSKFLSTERVRLMLDESEFLFNKAKEQARFVCCDVLGINSEDLSLDQLEGGSLKQHAFWERTLQHDEQHLKKVRTQLRDRIEQWLSNDQHREAIAHHIAVVYTELSEALGRPIQRLLDADNVREAALRISTSSMTGISYASVSSDYLLLSTEQNFYQLVEKEITKVAEYYLHELDRGLQEIQLLSLLEEKSYGQAYTEIKEPVTATVTRHCLKLKEAFREATRAITLYELFKMPIELPLEHQGTVNIALATETFEKSLQELAPEIINLGRDVVLQVVQSMLPAPLQRFLEIVRDIAVQKNVSVTEGGSDTKEASSLKPVTVEWAHAPVKLLDKSDLVSHVQKYGSVRDSRKLNEILQQQFAFRYAIALSSSLIYIERMFRYECGKLDTEIERATEELLKGHRSAVYLGYGTIREKIESIHANESQGFDRASRCLREILALEATGA